VVSIFKEVVPMFVKVSLPTVIGDSDAAKIAVMLNKTVAVYNARERVLLIPCGSDSDIDEMLVHGIVAEKCIGVV
jgi:hypothetical protein